MNNTVEQQILSPPGPGRDDEHAAVLTTTHKHWGLEQPAQLSIDLKEDADEHPSRDRPNGSIRDGFSRR